MTSFLGILSLKAKTAKEIMGCYKNRFLGQSIKIDIPEKQDPGPYEDPRPYGDPGP